MKKVALLVAMLSAFALADNPYCWQCKSQQGGIYCTSGWFNGYCACIDNGQQCSGCGACIIYKCVFPCLAPTPAVEAAWRKWPWLTDTGFADKLEVQHEHILALLIRNQQTDLNDPTHKCQVSVYRGGMFYADPAHKQNSPIVEWEATTDNVRGEILYKVKWQNAKGFHYFSIAEHDWRILDKNGKVLYGEQF